MPDDIESLKNELILINSEIENHNSNNLDEEYNRNLWKNEIARRKHNYLGLVLEIMQGLEENNKMQSLIDSAKEKLKQEKENKNNKK